MTSPRVVSALDPGQHCLAGFGTGFEGFAINEFTLQAGEETLGRGIVKRITDRSHGRLHTHLAAAVAERQTGVLATLDALLNVKRQIGPDRSGGFAVV
jgi:hypothetical protein